MPIIDTGTLEDNTLRGDDHGATVSLILDNSGPGGGPRLHKHPYDETWVVERGELVFQLGEELYDVGSGDVVIVPPDVPHKFTNKGPERSRMVCIHASPRMITEWLE
jgi:mannose-6-phosphate isomerase-like protein (cupin superfamily)